MKDEIHEELLLKKNQKTNMIDDLVNSQSRMGSMKKCTFCQATDINNRKRVCPNCHNKLPTISKMNQQFNKLPTIKNITNKSLVICPYRFKESDAQRSFPEVYKPQWKISEEMKRFSEIARMKRIEFIKAKLINKTALDIWHPIPITCEEADHQKNESSLKKSEILSIINSLIHSLGNSDRLHFRSLLNKSYNDLINISQEIRSVLAKNDININSEE
ncbi:11267_t:CDS:2 [Dentiscutata erythropus]|uniref:11267_t:CDS:1 n=1 Tax=Dentiscutata erythropus TaxID=1348616 RepID=A0A9N9IPF1_9GLOM|nr:11267_t:CDS:2 [Dentiscutata erythropus]